MFEKLGKSLDQLWKEFQTGLAQFLLSFEFIRSQPDLDRFVSRVQSFLLVCIFFWTLNHRTTVPFPAILDCGRTNSGRFLAHVVRHTRGLGDLQKRMSNLKSLLISRNYFDVV